MFLDYGLCIEYLRMNNQPIPNNIINILDGLNSLYVKDLEEHRERVTEYLKNEIGERENKIYYIKGIEYAISCFNEPYNDTTDKSSEFVQYSGDADFIRGMNYGIRCYLGDIEIPTFVPRKHKRKK